MASAGTTGVSTDDAARMATAKMTMSKAVDATLVRQLDVTDQP